MPLFCSLTANAVWLPASSPSAAHNLDPVFGIPGAANAKPVTQRAGQVVFGVGSVLLIK
jgi:hypothetical protein